MTRDALISAMPKGLWFSAERAADALKSAEKVIVGAHIDADGIAAAAIAQTALARIHVESEVLFFKKLDETAINELRKRQLLVWYVDLGSGSLSKIEGSDAVVTDHHALDPSARKKSHKSQLLLTDFSTVRHVNPQEHGLSGANDLSGAGSTFLTALAMDPKNADLACLAVLGAVGDLQDQKTRRLEGLNREVLALGVELGLIQAKDDIRYFGRETRPVHKMLEYSSDPFIPGVTGNEEGAIAFLLDLGVDLKEGDSWKTWADLKEWERSLIINGIKEHLQALRRKPDTVQRLTGEVYVFEMEPKGTPLRDAKEFATLLNACGRHAKADIGLAICTGDRGNKLEEGMALLRDHRSALSQALGVAKEKGIFRLTNIQFFDAGDEIEDTIIGTVAGMLLGSAEADRTAPMVAFAESLEYSEIPRVKASSRTTQDLVSKGVDLAVAIREAAERVGGVGGGHNIAAGATIPAESKEEFLRILDDIVGSQLQLRRAQRRG